MNCKNIMFMSVLFIVLPVWIGIIWVKTLKIQGKWECFLHAWMTGFVTMLSVAQIILVPMVALHATLSDTLFVWKMALTALSLLAFFLIVLDWKKKIETCEGESLQQMPAGKQEKHNVWVWIFAVFVAVLVFMQAYIPARYEHGDDDDSRFISEEVSAVEHDTMYWDDPITIDQLYWNVGEVRKDFTSPWAMYVAMCSKISNIPPAVLSHTYLPFFLIILCYGVYFLIGHTLLKGKLEETLIFLIFLSVIHLWGYTSTHTLASMLLLRIWQGKAVCASLMLPVIFYTMYQILQREYKKGWVVFLYAAGNAACLLSGIGIVTTPILLFIYGVTDFFCHRNWKKLFAIWMAAIPCILYLLYYLIS